MKLPVSSIKTWADLKKLFLVHFFKDVTKVAMPTLLDTKQKKEESSFVERFQSMALHYLSGMSQSILVETCCPNLQTALLIQIGVAKCRNWK